MSSNWAICIGINHYDNLQPLEYAQRDAETLKNFFEGEVGFDRVYYFAESAPPIPSDYGQPIRTTPSYANLMRFFRIRFEEPFLKPSDNIWFFFAGHGRRERDQDYILPIDADPGNVAGTAIPANYISERLRRSGADNVILLLDACRNEGARDGMGICPGRQKGIVTVCSCSPAERSYEISDLKHGAFTYALLEGLRLQGEGNCATVERLDHYLSHRVPEICLRYRKPRQTPYTHAEPIAKRHLILLPSVALPEDLEPIKLDALHAEAVGDLLLAEQLWWRVNAVAPTDAQVHEAIKRITLKMEQSQRHSDAIPQPRSDSLPLPSNTSTNPAESRNTTLYRVPTLTRRHLFHAGISGLGLAAVGSLALKYWPLLDGGQLPRSTATFQYVTVNAKGELNSPELQSIDVLTQPLDADTSLDLAVIPSNNFMMGSPESEPQRLAREGPPHPVEIDSFAIARTAITQAQWRAVVQATANAAVDFLPPEPASFPGDQSPVETVSWVQAQTFCERLSKLTGRRYRLPSEAEWEYACRAGTTTPFHFGETLTPALANYCGTGGAVCGSSYGKDVSGPKYANVNYGAGVYENGPTGTFRGGTVPVRSFLPNAFGLYEMHGNVWEHCFDVWQEDYRGAPKDGSPNVSGREDMRVLRGGSWSHHPAICRSAFRDPMLRGVVGWQGRVGFRVVLEI